MREQGLTGKTLVIFFTPATRGNEWFTITHIETYFTIQNPEESEKLGLKLNIQKTKIMASGPITSWPIDGETVADFIWGSSKITEDGDYSYEIKRCLLLGRKVMTTQIA